jgi:hypothetical protein
MKILHWLTTIFVNWFNKEVEPIRKFRLSDFNKLKYEVQPCDVLLIEGRKRISRIIKLITQTSWSHSALYIGRLMDIEDRAMQKKVSEFYQGEPQEQLVIESLLGKGTIISPLAKYAKEHIRICRPEEISHNDAQKVIRYCIKHLGVQYDFRQIFDLARLLLPWPLLPRKWHSSLFNYKPGSHIKESCSSLLAEAFQLVHFPIMPIIQQEGKNLKILPRNPRLFTPRDFDYSPFFKIVKYPMNLSGTKIPQTNYPRDKPSEDTKS